MTLAVAATGAARGAGGIWRPADAATAVPVSLSPGQVRAGAALVTDLAQNQVRAMFAGGLAVTATYGSDAGLAGQILRTVRGSGAATATAGARPFAAERSPAAATGSAPAAAGSPPAVRRHGHRRHSRHHRHHHHRRPVKGFDTCSVAAGDVQVAARVLGRGDPPRRPDGGVRLGQPVPPLGCAPPPGWAGR